MAGASQIYSSQLEAWEGERKASTPVAWLIGVSGFRNLLASSGCLGKTLFFVFLVLGYGFLVAASILRHQGPLLVQLPAFQGFGEISTYLNRYDEIFYQKLFLFRPANLFMTFVLLFYGSQLIAKDRGANALQVYFSKAVRPIDYLLGKYLTIGMFAALVTLLPSGLMLGLGLVLSTRFFAFLAEAWYVPLLVFSYWLCLSFILGTFVLFFSSLVNRAYQAAASFLGFLLLSGALSKLLSSLFGPRDWILGLSWADSLVDLGTVLFDLKIATPSLFFWQMIDLLIVLGIFVLLLLRRIRPVEVVK